MIWPVLPYRVSGVGSPMNVRTLPSCAASSNAGSALSPDSVTRNCPLRRWAISASSCIRLCSHAFIVEARFAMVSTPFLYVYPPNCALQPPRTLTPSSLKVSRT